MAHRRKEAQNGRRKRPAKPSRPVAARKPRRRIVPQKRRRERGRARNQAPMLPDREVYKLRVLRATSLAKGSPVSWDELGERFGIAGKTAYRYCLGLNRRTAGGPIEPAPGRRTSQPFDVNQKRRCRICGAKVHPPCFACLTFHRCESVEAWWLLHASEPA